MAYYAFMRKTLILICGLLSACASSPTPPNVIDKVKIGPDFQDIAQMFFDAASSRNKTYDSAGNVKILFHKLDSEIAGYTSGDTVQINPEVWEQIDSAKYAHYFLIWHELGHWIGLNHVDNGREIMYPYILGGDVNWTHREEMLDCLFLQGEYCPGW
jgi:hypothetical protein